MQSITNMILVHKVGAGLSLMRYAWDFLTELVPPVLSKPKGRRKRNTAARHDRLRDGV